MAVPALALMGLALLAAPGRAQAVPADVLSKIMLDARTEFEKTYDELGSVGSSALSEARELRRTPIAPRYGLISGLPLPLPAGLAASYASAEKPLPAPAR